MILTVRASALRVPVARLSEKVSVLVVETTCKIFPPPASANDKFPEPSVFKTWLAVQSSLGSLNSTSLEEGFDVGTANETALPPECTSLIFPVMLIPPLL